MLNNRTRRPALQHSIVRRTLRLTLLVALLAVSIWQQPVQVARASQQIPFPLTDVITISAGASHTCALLVGGKVMCWGYNAHGALGEGSTTDRVVPVQVAGLESGVVAISAGRTNTCAITDADGLKCWGDNHSGLLGDGTEIDRYTPVDVVGLDSGVVAVSTGDYHTCALTDAGGVKCWGYNFWGQVGDNSADDRLTPVDVFQLTSGVVAITTGSLHTCALTDAGAVKCWGANFDYQLGDTTDLPRNTPQDVFGLGAGISAIAAGGFHTCSLSTTGAVRCWGDNLSGQVGDGTKNPRPIPVEVVSLDAGVVQIDAGGNHTCARLTGDALKCWGANARGELGDGTELSRVEPMDVVGLGSGVSAVSLGHQHTCARLDNTQAKCWGRNEFGRLGDGTAADRTQPVDVIIIKRCYALTTGHSGSGDDPVPAPGQTPGCPAGHYLAGESIDLSAVPAANQRVAAWSDVDQTPAAADLDNVLTMPATDHSINVSYEACFALTTGKNGQGATPVPAPGASTGCPAARYAAGEVITLTASPAAGWRVASWSGTADDTATTVNNSLTMPAAAKGVAVTYAEIPNEEPPGEDPPDDEQAPAQLFLPLLR